MTTVLRRSASRAALIPTLLVTAVALTACGGDDTSSTNASAGTSTTQSESQNGDGQRQGGRFAMDAETQACLKKQGVEVPERPAGGTGDERLPRGDGSGQRPEGGLPGSGGAPPADGSGGPRGGMSDEQREKFQAALKACGANTERQPGNGGRDRPDRNSAAYQTSIKDYVACVRKNGYDLPDPDFAGDGPIFDAKKVDQQDATFRKASAACQSKLQTGSSGDAEPSDGSKSSDSQPSSTATTT